MEENAIQTNGGIMINVDVNVKNAVFVKKIMFEILLHVVMDYSAVICDEVIESYDKKKKLPYSDKFWRGENSAELA